VLLVAGLGLRWMSVRSAEPVRMATPRGAAKSRQRGGRVARHVDEERSLTQLRRLRQAFNISAVLSYLGIAVFFSSLWALIALFVIVLPLTLYRLNKDRQTSGTQGTETLGETIRRSLPPVFG